MRVGGICRLPVAAHDERQLGRLIARQRRSRGWSLSELARRAGVGKATLSRWENGDAAPAIPVLEAVLVALDADLDTRESAYALIGAPRGVRALRASEARHREDQTELGIGSLTLGDMIRALRVRRGLRSADVAAAVGVTPATISHWEKGERAPDFEARMRLARALQATLNEQSMLVRASLGLARAGMPGHDELVARFLPLKQRVRDLDMDGVELEFVLLCADSWRLSKVDPRGLSLLKSVHSQLSMIMAERGYAKEAVVHALRAHDIQAPPHPEDAPFYSPHAILAWAGVELDRERPSERNYRRAIRYYQEAEDAATRKEILLQSLQYPARWGDFEELERIRAAALSEHESAFQHFDPLDLNWLLAECYALVGRHHEALELLPASAPFRISQVHVDCLWAKRLAAVGDSRRAGEHYARMVGAVESSGFSGPEERALMAAWGGSDPHPATESKSRRARRGPS
ncbi:MAG TPA: helix-turn-helix transcriptional regulator [Fimbriimonadaceae bacterium]|nr:helix-turn-helix transcriptional regulator [Fimbriimonadaceae bacterium]HRJ95047.1 helix-turn-helix transcriptional regulator [Fimbriimonadaceae bacterium]